MRTEAHELGHSLDGPSGIQDDIPLAIRRDASPEIRESEGEALDTDEVDDVEPGGCCLVTKLVGR